jgi:hypothetical protein
MLAAGDGKVCFFVSFSASLPGIEPGPPGLQAEILTTKPYIWTYTMKYDPGLKRTPDIPNSIFYATHLRNRRIASQNRIDNWSQRQHMNTQLNLPSSH